MNQRRFLVTALVAVCCAFTLVDVARAGPYTIQGPFVAPVDGAWYIPKPHQVPGKEYTNFRDRNGFPLHTPNPGQVILWDGAGGTMNGPNYRDEVDALANLGDALFDSVIRNRSALLFSVWGAGGSSIYYEDRNGGIGVWAAPLQIDQVPPEQVDALEVWGPEGASDANRYSLQGDPLNCSVFIAGGGCLAPMGLLAAALGVTAIDVDGLMVNGDLIMFSIRATGKYDGGEIFVMDLNNPGNWSYLNHGGHLWDTAFNVSAVYPGIGTDVSALEAVNGIPEPGGYVVLGLALLALRAAVRRS